MTAERVTSASAPSRRWWGDGRTHTRLGTAVYVVAVLNISTGLLHTWRVRLGQLTDLLPGALSSAAAAATVVAGVYLFALGHALKRRKRRALRAASALLVLSVGLNIVKEAPVSALVSATVLLLLVLARGEFFAVGDQSTRWRAVWSFFALLTFSILVGTGVYWANDDAISGGWPGLTQVVVAVLAGMVGVTSSVQLGETRAEDVIGALLLGLGLMTSLTTIYLVLRSPEPRPRLTTDDESRVRELLDKYPDSLGYFALRDDKAVVWSPTGKSAIGYRVISGVMLAAGDPIGDPEAWPGAIREFCAQAELHAWTPAVLGCSEQGGRVWTRETGFDALELGDEAIIDTATFSLEGRAMRNVRQMVNRVRRAGYECEVMRVRDMLPERRRAIIRDADAWRGTATERGFSMALGRVADARDPNSVVATASKDGVVRGVLQFAPWGREGMSLDLMRRDRAADAGLSDLLIVDAIAASAALGMRQVSLNFAVFRSALEGGEKLGAGPVLRMWCRLLVFVSRWFQIESLYRFNAKFQPAWNPRFIVYPSASTLPRIALAALEAEAFLVWPRLPALLGGKS